MRSHDPREDLGRQVARLTAWTADAGGQVVWVETEVGAGMTGSHVKVRRRGPADSALGQTRRQLAYKTAWYGSRLVVADRWYPSSRTCHACGHVQEIGWNEHWICTGCGTSHQRDENAAINLARYEPLTTGDSALGPVGAAVKRGAGHKTRPRRAGGDEKRKRPQPSGWRTTPRRGADE